MIILKTILFIILFLSIIPFLLSAFPHQKSQSTCYLETSIDFFTKSTFFSETRWFSTIMPSYSAGYEFAWILKDRFMHLFKGNIRYFGSNTFSYNSVPLKQSEMNYMVFDILIGYDGYIPILDFFSFIIGGEAILSYKNYGYMITYNESNIIDDIIIYIGPILGVSIFYTDFIEFFCTTYIDFGMPCYGNYSYPDLTTDDITDYSIRAGYNLNIAMYLSWFTFSIGYNFNTSTILSIINTEEDTILPRDIDIMSFHRIFLKLGISF